MVQVIGEGGASMQTAPSPWRDSIRAVSTHRNCGPPNSMPAQDKIPTDTGSNEAFGGVLCDFGSISFRKAAHDSSHSGTGLGHDAAIGCGAVLAAVALNGDVAAWRMTARPASGYNLMTLSKSSPRGHKVTKYGFRAARGRGPGLL